MRLGEIGKEKENPYPDFFYFGTGFVTTRSTNNSFPPVYFVSKKTGGIWEAKGASPDLCYLVSFPELKWIMAQTGGSFAADAGSAGTSVPTSDEASARSRWGEPVAVIAAGTRLGREAALWR